MSKVYAAYREGLKAIHGTTLGDAYDAYSTSGERKAFALGMFHAFDRKVVLDVEAGKEEKKGE